MYRETAFKVAQDIHGKYSGVATLGNVTRVKPKILLGSRCLLPKVTSPLYLPWIP